MVLIAKKFQPRLSPNRENVVKRGCITNLSKYAFLGYMIIFGGLTLQHLIYSSRNITGSGGGVFSNFTLYHSMSYGIA